MKTTRFFLVLIFLLMVPLIALADCQCVQPNIGQSGYSAPTCTQPGYYYLECLDCGAQWKEEAQKPLGHDWSPCGYHPATCIKEGATLYQCTRCLAEKSESIPKGAHNYVYSMTNPAFCETDGKTWYECSVCGDTRYDTIPATGHSDKIYSTTGDACTTGVTRVWKCQNCKRLETEVLPAMGHRWESTGENLPTCVKAGYETFKCTICGTTKQETLNPTGKHTYTLELSRTEPTCTKDGQKVIQCEYCSAEITEKIYSGGHNWSIVSTTPATCDTPKIVHSECTKCGEKKEQKVGSAAGHSWKDGQVIKQPTCTEDGKASSVCSVCGKAENERVLAKLGHTWGTAKIITFPTCTSAGKSESTCLTCGEKKTESIKKTAHSWGEWRTTKEPTETATGTKERTCKNCGTTETETLPKKGAKPTATPKPTAKPSSAGNAAQTQKAGDGKILVFTTSGKVNTRTGPGKENKLVQQIAKRNTNLGELLDAQADSKGVVWFQVQYKKKACWVTSEYAKLEISTPDGSIRRIGENTTELKDHLFKSSDLVAAALNMTASAAPAATSPEWRSEYAAIFGSPYVEQICLFGRGYSLYGVEVGDAIQDAAKALSEENLVLQSKQGDAYTYCVPVRTDALSADEEGFCGYLVVLFGADRTITEIRLYSHTTEPFFANY